MSAALEATSDMSCCANCGKAEGDDIKLKKCACKLVKYCSAGCQKNHRSQHKKACKKRMAEMRNDRLFRQPEENDVGECPICCLPLPIDKGKFSINSCCSKYICNGCNHANKRREIEQGQYPKCPYCREPLPKTQEENDQNCMKRVKTNDPLAIRELGKRCRDTGDYNKAFEHFTQAADLGDIEAHFEVSLLYRNGKGVEKDMKKAVYHLEEAAIGGHPEARYNLGCYEGRNSRFDRATKHFIIAAKLGHDGALDKLKQHFLMGFVSKEDYEAALRGHQAAVDETKSEQRDAAEDFAAKKIQSAT